MITVNSVTPINTRCCSGVMRKRKSRGRELDVMGPIQFTIFIILSLGSPIIGGYFVYDTVYKAGESGITNNYGNFTVVDYCSDTYNCGPDARRYSQCYYPCISVVLNDMRCNIPYNDGLLYSQSQYAIDASRETYPIGSGYMLYYTDDGNCSRGYKGNNDGSAIFAACFTAGGIFFVGMGLLICLVQMMHSCIEAYYPWMYVDESATQNIRSNIEIIVVSQKT